MSMNRINRQRAWGVWGLCIVFLMASFNMVSASTEKASGTSAEADVANWLAELDAHPAAAGLSETVKSGGQARNSGSSKRGRDRSVKKQAGPQKISIDFYKVDLHNVFRLLGKISKKNIVVDEGVKGTLTLALQDVPWTFVLQVIKNLKGLSSQEINNTIMIYPVDKKMEWEAGVEGGDVELEVLTVENEEKPDEDQQLLDEFMLSKLENSRFLIEKKRMAAAVSQEDMERAWKIIQAANNAEKNNNLQQAYDLLSKASKIWPCNPDLDKKIAIMAFKLNRDLDAYNYAKKAYSLNPDDSELVTLIALALSRMGKKNEAKAYFNKVMSAENIPRDALWNYAVFSFSDEHDYRKTLRLINRIENLHGLDPDMIMLKAMVFENLGQNRRAIEEYGILLKAGNVPENIINAAKNKISALESAESVLP